MRPRRETSTLSAMASPEGFEPSANPASETGALPLSYEDMLIGTHGESRTPSLPVRSRALFQLSFAGMAPSVGPGALCWGGAPSAPGKSRTCSRRLRTPVPIQLGVGGNGVAEGNRSARSESARSSEAPSPCRHGVAGGNRTLVHRCCRPVPGHSDPPQAGRWVRERFRSHGVVPWCPRTHEPGAPGGI